MKSPRLFTLLAIVTFVGSVKTTSPPSMFFLTPSYQQKNSVFRNASWECEIHHLIGRLAESEVILHCPVLRDPINSCCMAHKKCYRDRKGKTYCDDVLCDCLETRTRSESYCHDVSASAYCLAARHFGDSAYELAQ
ncbi:unnamed protein product [Caenorhabditis angaria]|uniref:Domain of unknown function DB domain-containing protein n=1 Tax=Caenorhabditis angaria TaxID=860376 RepID=A0A9P1MT89_9PELO|nr:unnamed protein product [Caenorhabditis angaria]